MAGHVEIHETLYRMSEHCLWFLILIDFLFLVLNVTFSNITQSKFSWLISDLMVTHWTLGS
jgi:hypothetical protein